MKTKFKDVMYSKVGTAYGLTNGCQAKIAMLLDQQKYIYPNAETVSVEVPDKLTI